MKAMVLTGPGQLEARRVAVPAAEAETLVRVTHSGICGTDLKIFDGAIPAHYPLIMGHEITGEIISGVARDGSGPGTRALVDPDLFCGTCFHCRHGRTQLCTAGRLVGRDLDGGFAEQVAVPPENVYALPDEVGPREAALLQVLTTCLHAQDLGAAKSGEAVVVTGLGVTGQLHLQLAKVRGAEPVIGVSRNAWKRELALALGADLVFEHGEAARKGVLEATGGLGADLVVETVGKLAALAEAIDLARAAGRIVPFGIYTEPAGKLPFYEIYFKELEIIGARAAGAADFPATIELVRSGALDLEPLLTHTLPLDELGRALGLLTESGVERMKVILEH